MKRKSRLLYIFLIIIIMLSVFSITYFSRELINDTKMVGLISLVILVIALAWLIGLIISDKQRKIEKTLTNRLSMWNSISYQVKKAGETAFNNLPIGIMIINENYTILWSNSFCKRIFMSPLENIELENLSKELFLKLQKIHFVDQEAINEPVIAEDINLDKNNLSKKVETSFFEIDIYGETYRIDYIKEHRIIYLTNITEHLNLITKYRERTVALGYINIDNFEEALSEFDVQERAEYNGKIIGMIAKWVEEFGAFVRAFSDNRYLLIMDRYQLEGMMASKFPILDDIKNIMHGNKMLRVTLSIGICCIDDNIEKVSEGALSLLDLALNRGGDQVAVKLDNKTIFFGAKEEAMPKEAKVEVRIKSEELQDLIAGSSTVFAMGHVMLDADGFGAALSIYKLAKALGKQAYIVLNQKSIDATVMRIYDSIYQNYIELSSEIITPEKAVALADENSLLMIVDFQTIYQLPDDKIMKKFKNLGIIDHHRKGAGAIETSKFYYSKTYASSSVEIIMELAEFWKKDIEFDALEATWLLLGIIVDTNNFIYRTNAKTFEVASTLKRYGADMTVVQRYLKDDFTEVKIRNEFIKNIELYKDVVAISAATDNTIYERPLLAKISDQMIGISGIELGITIGYIDEEVIGLSTRSLGKINAQTIMEKMGGGGHLNNAAAQVRGLSIDQIVRKLKSIIDEVLVDLEKERIVFTKDVKGKGKKYEIKELEKEIADELIKEGQAIIASAENLKLIENRRRSSEIQREKYLQKMKDLKKVIESKPITINAKIEKGGLLKGAIPLKQIVELMEKEYSSKIDAKKIDYLEPITTLGTHKVMVNLYKDIIAELTIFIVEK